MLKNLPYYRILIDERDDPHLSPALQTLERVHIINALEKRKKGGTVKLIFDFSWVSWYILLCFLWSERNIPGSKFLIKD
jgi:hypothetical protein